MWVTFSAANFQNHRYQLTPGEAEHRLYAFPAKYLEKLAEAHDVGVSPSGDDIRFADNTAVVNLTPSAEEHCEQKGTHAAVCDGALPRFGGKPLIVELTNTIGEHTDVFDLLQHAIAEEPSVVLRDGDVIAPGYDADLDELRRISSHTDEFLLELEQRERERSGIPSLKLAYNRVSGFFIEVNRSQAERVPKAYIRRKTVKNAERFEVAVPGADDEETDAA